MEISIDTGPGVTWFGQTLAKSLLQAGVTPLWAYVILVGTALILILMWKLPEIIRARSERLDVRNRHAQEMLKIRTKLNSEAERRRR